MKKTIVILLSVIVVAGLTGCACMQKSEPAPAPAPAKIQPARVAPAPAAVKSEGQNVVSRTYCSACGDLKIEKIMPASVAVGQPFDYTILVTNLTDMEMADIIVKDTLPANFAFKSASPASTPADNELMWTLPKLGPKAQQKMIVSGSAKAVGYVQTCSNATYIIPACARTQVVQPALSLTKSATPEALLCDVIVLKYNVCNKGTGVASNVMITDPLPEGLTLATGQKKVEIKVGDLAPGKCMDYTLNAKVAKTGSYKSGALAVADGGLKAETEAASTVVKQPVLAITKTGPEKQYIGRTIKYEITVANKGDASANDVTLTDTVPAGVSQVMASDGGQAAGGNVSWKLGALAAGQSRKVSVSYMPQGAGSFSNIASASATCAESVKASAKTDVMGIAAILLEVVDVSDPIEVGKNETYVITVTNQGSAPDTEIVVKCTLEEGMQYVSASGATTGSFADGAVTFRPLATLAPKATVTWKVEVKATKAGDVRFTTSLTSKQLGREVMETEATNFYE
jgi:uncharacterized repeat protein (TIGR01451 family)